MYLILFRIQQVIFDWKRFKIDDFYQLFCEMMSLFEWFEQNKYREISNNYLFKKIFLSMYIRK